SLHPEMTRLFRKGNALWTSLQLLKWALEFGIRVEWNLLYGAPGESDSWYAETAEWMAAVSHLQAPATLARVEYDRFSPYQTRPDEFGITLSRYRTYEYVYPLPDPELTDLAYYFEDYVAGDRGALDPTRFPGLAAWHQEARRWRMGWLLADRNGGRPPQL